MINKLGNGYDIMDIIPVGYISILKGLMLVARKNLLHT